MFDWLFKKKKEVLDYEKLIRLTIPQEHQEVLKDYIENKSGVGDTVPTPKRPKNKIHGVGEKPSTPKPTLNSAVSSSEDSYPIGLLTGIAIESILDTSNDSISSSDSSESDFSGGGGDFGGGGSSGDF